MSDRTSALAIVVMLLVTACVGNIDREQQIKDLACRGFCQVIGAHTTTKLESNDE